MKKNLTLLALMVIIIIQFLVIINMNQDKDEALKNAEATQENDSVNEPVDIVNSYLMNNPVDNYYSPKLNSKIEVEVRDTDEEYEKTWEEEYNKVIGIIRNKCVYDMDRDNINNYDKSVQNMIKTATPVMETEFLEAYPSDPDIPENRGWGNSTYSSLERIKGQIYRDGCMILIPYLKGEYEFPTMPEN